MSYLYKV